MNVNGDVLLRCMNTWAFYPVPGVKRRFADLPKSKNSVHVLTLGLSSSHCLEETYPCIK